ncbi:hypothetical protein NQ314_015027 [Rhamnusium bicolor]|uniref:DDE Tnp4 domain-containing protein n=1 Tax=Rhamnusium bicolor TaxID=1586634 RepID=A0AAV8X043_9CUCU|nr:hypothetical protein NQ314_015027 [Rhamnusium bicolor]
MATLNFLNTAPNTPEATYTETHIRERNYTERLNGIFKARFRCIMGDRKLRYDSVKVGHIINACAILHNICVEGRLDNDFEIEIQMNDVDMGNQVLLHNEGNIARQNLIKRILCRIKNI